MWPAAKLPQASNDALTATKQQIIKHLAPRVVRSIYGNARAVMMDRSHAMTGVVRAREDADVTSHNGGLALTGRGVNVAVLDTGWTHARRPRGRVVRNVKLADMQSASVGFIYRETSRDWRTPIW